MSRYKCECDGPLQDRKKQWRVMDRNCNYSAFNGYHRTPSDYSSLLCLKCGQVWRTKAAYVAEISTATQDERYRI